MDAIDIFACRDKPRDNIGPDQPLLLFPELILQLQRGYRAIVDQIVTEAGLTSKAAWPLFMIAWHDKEGLCLSQLAKILDVKPWQLSQQILQLKKAGYVEYRRDPQITHARLILLTPLGIAVRTAVDKALREFRNNLFRGISGEEMATCIQTFRAIASNLGIELESPREHKRLPL